MMFKTKAVQIGKLFLFGASTTGLGVLAGIKFGKKLVNSDLGPSTVEDLLITKKPGLPLFGTVSAATPIVENRLAPVVAAPAVTVPEKELPGLPAEPPPGTNRIAEIMRFGFPGLDNIRSHRYHKKHGIN